MPYFLRRLLVEDPIQFLSPDKEPRMIEKLFVSEVDADFKPKKKDGFLFQTMFDLQATLTIDDLCILCDSVGSIKAVSEGDGIAEAFTTILNDFNDTRSYPEKTSIARDAVILLGNNQTKEKYLEFMQAAPILT